MALRLVRVHVDEADVALIKEASGRLGVSEDELIREGIHRIAMACRVWDEPFIADEQTIDLGEADPTSNSPHST
ncbi:hypothetical protein ACYSUO_36725 [Streptomyces sp. UC4497]